MIMGNVIYTDENTSLQYSFNSDALQYFLKGKKAFNDEDNTEAIRMFDKALTYDPHNTYILNFKANSYLQLKDSNSAEQCLKYILASEPKNYVASYRLGMHYYNYEKNLNLAIQYLENSLANFPNFNRLLLTFPLPTVSYVPKHILLTNLSNFKLQVCEKSGKYSLEFLKVMEKHLLEAIDLVPVYAIAFSNLGRVFILMKDFDRALRTFKRSAELGSENALVRYQNLLNKI